MSQLDKILSGFNKTIKKLENYSQISISDSERHDHEAMSHTNRAKYLREEADRAKAIAAKLSELVS